MNENIKKVSETINTITSSKRKRKTTVRSEGSYKYLDLYDDLATTRLIPVSEEFLERLGGDLVKWARESNAIKLTAFFIERGISRGTYQHWAETHPLFKKHIEFAKEAIGNRREEAAFWRKADAGIFLKSAANYDPEWKEIEAWRSRVAKHEEDTENHFTIVMPDDGSEGGTKEIKYSTPKPR
jgi:hypothetical protein